MSTTLTGTDLLRKSLSKIVRNSIDSAVGFSIIKFLTVRQSVFSTKAFLYIDGEPPTQHKVQLKRSELMKSILSRLNYSR